MNEDVKSENLRIHSRADELIACLEGEIAKRDARIAELSDHITLVVEESNQFRKGRDQLRAELSAAKETISRYETTAENCDLLRGELAALKAQEPVEYQLRALIRDVTNIPEAGYYMPQSWHDQVIALSLSGQLDAPVSEAKAQGDAWAPSVNDYDHSIHSNPDAKEWADFFVATFPGLADKHDLMIGWFANAMMAMHDHLARKAQGMVMPERKTKADYGVYIGEFADEAAVIYNAALDEVTSLNAAPVQQVSVPDGWRELAKAVTALDQVPRSSGHAMPKPEQVRAEAAVIRAARAMLTAAPAAPAADAGHVFYGMDGNHP